MKLLNRTATRTFLQLVAGLAPGQARRIDNAAGAFMAVSVDFLREEGGARFYAVAHRYEQGGDLVSDPDVEFWVVGEMVAPVAIDQAPGYRRHVEFEDGRAVRMYRRGQADLADFCNVWMRNIREQQGDLREAAAAA